MILIIRIATALVIFQSMLFCHEIENSTPGNDFIVFDTLSGAIIFSGQVMQKESFNARISDDLWFALIPYTEYGWIIWVGKDTTENYCRVATPPYRGLNSTVIEGWHFRNEDNSGPNEGSVNAPQHVRSFNFVLDEESFLIADNFVAKVSWPCDYSEEELNQAQERFESLSFGTGKLVITEMEFDNLTRGERTGFKYIKFDVEIYVNEFRERVE